MITMPHSNTFQSPAKTVPPWPSDHQSLSGCRLGNRCISSADVNAPGASFHHDECNKKSKKHVMRPDSKINKLEN